MARGIIKLDADMILNMVKNDRRFEVTSGVPRDACIVGSAYNGDVLYLTVESEAIPVGAKDTPTLDVALFGNADAVDENGELKELVPATILDDK